MDNHKEAARRACIIVDQSMLMPGEKEAITKFMREQQQQLAAARSALAEERKGREQAEAALRGLETLFKERTDNYYDCITEKRQAEADARHFESLYRAAKVEFNFKDSEVDRLQEEIEALKVSNSIDAAGNEQFQKAFERAEQAEAQCLADFMNCDTCKHKRYSASPFAGVCHYNPYDFEDYVDGKETPECTKKNSKWEWNGYSKKPEHGVHIITHMKIMEEALKDIEKIPSCQEEACCYAGKTWAIAYNALKAIDPTFTATELSLEVDEEGSSKIHTKLKEAESEILRLKEALNKNDTN